MLLLLVLAIGQESLPAQVPENGVHADVDAFMLNRKFREMADRGLITKWSLSNGSDILTVEMTGQWPLMTLQMKTELTRRMLSVFAYYISNRDARQWNFSIVLTRDGARPAEDKGPWLQKGKGPEILQ